MRKITVIFETKQDSLYMQQVEISYPDERIKMDQLSLVEDEIHRVLPNCKDIHYVFDGWPNRIDT